MKGKIIAITLGLLMLTAFIGWFIMVHLPHSTRELSQVEFERMLQANLIANAELIATPKPWVVGQNS